VAFSAWTESQPAKGKHLFGRLFGQNDALTADDILAPLIVNIFVFARRDVGCGCCRANTKLSMPYITLALEMRGALRRVTGVALAPHEGTPTVQTWGSQTITCLWWQLSPLQFKPAHASQVLLRLITNHQNETDC
jgi:hypothetical protein